MNKMKRPTAIISITSFRGISSDARHFYGRLCILGLENIELFRPVTQSFQTDFIVMNRET